MIVIIIIVKKKRRNELELKIFFLKSLILNR